MSVPKPARRPLCHTCGYSPLAVYLDSLSLTSSSPNGARWNCSGGADSTVLCFAVRFRLSPTAHRMPSFHHVGTKEELTIIERLRRLPILHPILFAVYPVVALLNANLTEIPPRQAFRPLLFSLFCALLLVGLFRLMLSDWQKAGLLSSLSVLLLFSYGHVYGELETVRILGVQLGRHRHLIPGSLLLLLAAFLWAKTGEEPSRDMTAALNIIAAVAVLIPATNILLSHGQWSTLAAQRRRAGEETFTLRLTARNEQPDIYYIVPDTYARGDVLQQIYDYDNSDFYDFLRDRGFYVAERSTANYLWTHISLVSSLNLNYLPEVLPEYSKSDRTGVGPAIQNSLVRRSLEEAGYSSVGFATGWEATEIFDADIVMTPDMSTYRELQQRGLLNDFEGLLLESSAGLILLDIDALTSTPLGTYVAERLQDRFTFQREIVLALYRNLEALPAVPEPTFAFAHSLAPHGPHIFGPDGEPVDNEGAFNLAAEQDVPGGTHGRRYLDELTYVTKRLEGIVDAILEESDGPVVIVIQADHGPAPGLDWDDPTPEALTARMAILNAYYLPEACRGDLYPDITPVNSFRVILNCLYDADLPLLEDKTFNGFYEFAEIEQRNIELGGP